MEFSSHRRQLNYPLWLGLCLFMVGLGLWISVDPVPTAEMTPAVQPTTPTSHQTTSVAPKAKFPAVSWEIIGSEIPNKDQLYQCLRKQNFDESVVIVGSPDSGLTVMHSSIATPITVAPQGPVITLKSFMGPNLFAETRFHIGIAYCLYAPHARVFDPVLKRAYEEAGWPTLGPTSAAPISFFITVEKSKSPLAGSKAEQYRWLTHGMGRLDRPELALKNSSHRLNQAQTRKLMLATAARVVAAEKGAQTVRLKSIGQIDLTAISPQSSKEETTAPSIFLISKTGGGHIELSEENQPPESILKDHNTVEAKPEPRPTRNPGKRQRRPEAKSSKSQGFRPDYR